MQGSETGPDPQDQAEVFDETHVDDDGSGDVDFEEMERVLDVTHDPQDGSFGLTDRYEGHGPVTTTSDRIEAEADSLLGLPPSAKDDQEDQPPSSPEEIELVFTGLLRNQKGAQASAAHWEAKHLSDEDLIALGYTPDREKDA